MWPYDDCATNRHGVTHQNLHLSFDSLKPLPTVRWNNGRSQFFGHPCQSNDGLTLFSQTDGVRWTAGAGQRLFDGRERIIYGPAARRAHWSTANVFRIQKEAQSQDDCKHRPKKNNAASVHNVDATCFGFTCIPAKRRRDTIGIAIPVCSRILKRPEVSNSSWILTQQSDSRGQNYPTELCPSTCKSKSKRTKI